MKMKMQQTAKDERRRCSPVHIFLNMQYTNSNKQQVWKEQRIIFNRRRERTQEERIPRMETKWDVKELYDFNMDPLNHITGNDLLNSLVQETMGIPLKSNLFLQILCDFR